MGAVGVLLCGTLGIAAALATVARGKTSAVGNILIGAGVLVAAGCVLIQALRLIFTVRTGSQSSTYAATSSSSTQPLAVIWTAHHADGERLAREVTGANTPALMGGSPTDGVLRRPFWATVVAFGAVVALAAFVALPELFEGFLSSRPVGTAARTPVDHDGDGIPDRNDGCPRTPADTLSGCPATSVDRDGDGVPTARTPAPASPAVRPPDA
jgi:hypothetical protein